MLRWRLLLGTLIIAGFVGLCWLDARAESEITEGFWLLPVLIVATVLGTSETLHLLRAAGMQPLAGAVYAGNLLLVLGQWSLLGRAAFRLAMVEPNLWQLVGIEIAWPFVGLGIGLFMIFLGEMTRYEKPGGVTANIAAALFALVYIGLMLGFAVRLRLDWGVGALATWILAVKMGDTGAYTVGRLIGRHKLCPHLSPGKTIEGAIGALIFASIGAWVGFRWFLPTPPSAIMSLPHAIGSWSWLPFGVLMGTTGIIGDLAESLLKRDTGCKDSSTWMPGFGGILDILDSLLLSAPIAWFYWLLGYPLL